MLPFAARFYDGAVPEAHAVTASLSAALLIVRDANGTELARWPVVDLCLPPQDTSLPEAYIGSRAQPDARLVVADRQAQLALAEEIPALRSLVRRGSHGGRRAVTVLAGLLVGAAAFAGVLVWRGPELVAPLIPDRWQARLGDSMLQVFTEEDQRCTGRAGTAALEGLVDKLKAASGYRGELRVVVINDPMVNAFALPGGRIAVFDGLLQKAESGDEVSGVLAHEMGHVALRHPTRALLRQLGISALRRFALGDWGESVATAGSLGETMLALRNGRQAEREADAAALATLQRAGLRADGLHSFFLRMAKNGDAAQALGWLSTHPPLAEREEATVRGTEGASALTRAQWQALRGVCNPGKAPEEEMPPGPGRRQAPDSLPG